MLHNSNLALARISTSLLFTHKKVILFSSTLTHSQCDAGNITFL